MASERVRSEMPGTARRLLGLLAGTAVVASIAGCAGLGGYSNQALFPDDVASVRLEMFDNRSFRRGVEYVLSDALAKRIEVETPYKIVSSRDRTDSVMSGQLVAVGESILTVERDVARPLEKEVTVTAVVNWKNLNTGRIMINNETVIASASYSEFQNQDFTYASHLAVNKLAQKIVERMENKW
ncbi:MAG: hypothetical protein JW993_07935 [Sedimentisphaerales bacterium]|nr:hypothetical protein [Sedimentisphaerales bacterium]